MAKEATGIKLAVLGSGSRGNSIYIASSGAKVLVDAGFSCSQIEKRMERVGETLKGLDGIIISHEHQDHLKGAATLIKRYKIPLYISQKTLEASNISLPNPNRKRIINAGSPFSIADLCFHPFSLPHDASDPLGFVVQLNNIKVGIALDFGFPSKLVEQKLRHCSALVLECNHDPEMLMLGPYPWEVKQRIMSRLGHLSNIDLTELLRKILTNRVKFLLLAHLSQTNNHPRLAIESCNAVLQEMNNNKTKIIVAQQEQPSQLLHII